MRTNKQRRIVCSLLLALILLAAGCSRPDPVTDPSGTPITEPAGNPVTDPTQTPATEPVIEPTEEAVRQLADPAAKDKLLESWDLNQGTLGGVLPSLEDGAIGASNWTVWLKNRTFGKVLDFSTEGSKVYFEKTRLEASAELTLSVWIMAPVRQEQGSRVILESGSGSDADGTDGLLLYLDGDRNGELVFAAAGVSDIPSGGVHLIDGQWHHIAVSLDKESVCYYVDGTPVKAATVHGSFAPQGTQLVLGSDFAGRQGLDGSMAELRIFSAALTPQEATSTQLDPADNEPGTLRLPIQKGIVIDRRQYYQSEPLANEGQTVYEQDIVNCINMGFDHVKLLLTPNHLIAEDGSLKEEEMAYITRVVGYVEQHHFRCIVCLHPEGDFKPRYLGDLEQFEILIRWYGEFARFVKEHWSPDTVAIQLMTEPGNNSDEVSWTWESDRMWGAVRNVLPDHTILTSSCQYGNLERLKEMSPTSDPNLVYTFTTYEPYTIGWYFYSNLNTPNNPWAYVHDIPYPVEEGVDYTEAIEYAINNVPAELKSEIREQLWGYVRGEFDGYWTWWPNHYDSLYNANWHMLRAKSLDDWRQANGGHVAIMCVEFGCMDARTPVSFWRTAKEGYGITDEKRVEFVRDMRSAFDAYDIGWDYWSYNEGHTIFLTEVHSYGESPDPEAAANIFDYDMLKIGLGVTPLVSRSDSIQDVTVDPDWLVLDTVESKGSWTGTATQLRYASAASGLAYISSRGTSISLAKALSTKDSPAAYANGYLHLWMYVESPDKLLDGEVELMGTGFDLNWKLKDYVTASGWNELYLPCGGQALSGSLSYLFVSGFYSEDCELGIDYIYLCRTRP